VAGIHPRSQPGKLAREQARRAPTLARIDCPASLSQFSAKRLPSIHAGRNQDTPRVVPYGHRP
jgi:hypothetical protein